MPPGKFSYYALPKPRSVQIGCGAGTLDHTPRSASGHRTEHPETRKHLLCSWSVEEGASLASWTVQRGLRFILELRRDDMTQ
jgi:hypothetical protein